MRQAWKALHGGSAQDTAAQPLVCVTVTAAVGSRAKALSQDTRLLHFLGHHLSNQGHKKQHRLTLSGNSNRIGQGVGIYVLLRGLPEESRLVKRESCPPTTFPGPEGAGPAWESVMADWRAA